MVARETKRDISIDGRVYRLTKMDARLACFIFTTLAGRMEESGQLLASLSKMNRTEFDELQGYALKFVFRVEMRDDVELPIPILSGNGSVADPDLNADPGSLMNLTANSLMFNIEPFLAGSKSTEVP